MTTTTTGWAQRAFRVLTLTVVLAACTGRDDSAPAPSTVPDTAPPRTVVEGPLALDAVVRGDCLTGVVVGSSAMVELRAADLVSCDRPHDLEVFTTFPLRATDFEAEIGEYPGRARIVRAAEEGCDLRFRESVPTDQGLGLLSFWPTRESWETGDRTVACLVYPLDGQPLVGSSID